MNGSGIVTCGSNAAASDAAEHALMELVEAKAGRWEQVGTTDQGGRPTRVFKLAVGETPSKPADEQGFGYADSNGASESEPEADSDEGETEWME